MYNARVLFAAHTDFISFRSFPSQYQLYRTLRFKYLTLSCYLYLIASAPILVKSHKQRILSTHSKHIFFSQTEAKEKPAWVKRVFLRLALVFRYLPEGAAVASFTALVTGCKFSRAQQRLHVFPRLHRLQVLPPLLRVASFPALSSGCTFSRGCTGCMFSRP